MAVSGTAGAGDGAPFGGPTWLWRPGAGLGASGGGGLAQFSALVADAAPPEPAGTLMTLQTALGFTLTFFTVQAVPAVAAAAGWPVTLALMALGPMAGVAAMHRLIRSRSEKV